MYLSEYIAIPPCGTNCLNQWWQMVQWTHFKKLAFQNYHIELNYLTDFANYLEIEISYLLKSLENKSQKITINI